MLKVSKLNPNDETLDEIHQIQEQIYEKDKGLSRKKETERFNNSIREFDRSFHCSSKILTLEEVRR
ncbi:MAG: hypothetical protein ISS45_09885 [Candidatus Omnitrophica bacterium]|nr:hypothetical protein [Candidatus Omnitrophota bacterium]